MLGKKHWVLGQYSDDIYMDGTIYAKALRSKYPRARVDRVDVSKALEHPACVTALTAKDVPFNKTGHLVPVGMYLSPKVILHVM